MRKGEIIKHGIDQNNFGNIEKLQSFNKGQIYTKGFEFNTTAGNNNEFPIQLGGKARKLHGINFFIDPAFVTDSDKMSLALNSEQLIQNVVWWAYNPQQQYGNMQKPNEFFSLPRALSGADDCQLAYNSLQAHKIWIVFYLSDK